MSIFGLDLSGFVAFAFAAGLSATVFLSTYASSIAANRLRELEDKGIAFISRREMNTLKKKIKKTKAEQERLKTNSEYGKVLSAMQSARIAAVTFAIIEGVFNLAEVISAAISNGQITSPWGPLSLELFSIWVFAATPTVASILLALVIANFDRVKDSLDLAVEGFFEEVGVNKNKSKRRTPSFLEILPQKEEGILKDPDIENLRKKDFDDLTAKEKFMASMYNRNLNKLNTRLMSKSLQVDRRSIENWIKELEEKRKLSNGL